MEWSFNIETIVFIKFTLLWLSLEVLNIDDVPLLIELVVSSVEAKLLFLIILVLVDLHSIVVLNVDELRVVILEKLVPS
jgi:hypothetical protein